MENLDSILEGLLDVDMDVKDDDVLTFIQGGWRCSKCEMNGYWFAFLRGAVKKYYQDHEKLREYSNAVQKMNAPVLFNGIKTKTPFERKSQQTYVLIAQYVVWFMEHTNVNEKSCTESIYNACSDTFRPKPGEIKINYKDAKRKSKDYKQQTHTRRTITINCEYNGSVGSGNLGSHGVLALQFYKDID